MFTINAKANDEDEGLVKKRSRIRRSAACGEETMLDSSKVRYALGFIYLEYRKETYYWEIVKIVEKMAIIFVLNTYDTDVKLKGVLCFFIIFGYGILSLKSIY